MEFQEYRQQLNEWAQEQEPVFIVGPERSGTSLLFQQISNLPAFPDFKDATVETFCFIKPWHLLEAGNINNYEMRVYLGHKQLQSFQQSIQPLIKRNERLTDEGLSKAYLKESNRREIWQERRYRLILRAFFHHAWSNLGQQRLVEKTPAHVRCLQEVFDTFPNAKVLVCVRNIPEIIASHRKRLEKEVALGKSADDPALGWLCHSTENFLAHLKHVNFLVDTWLGKKPDNIRIVHYDRLTRAPEETLQTICEFIGEPFQPPQAEGQDRREQAWDPLLNQPPQPNRIAVDHYLDEAELAMIDEQEQSGAFSHYWK